MQIIDALEMWAKWNSSHRERLGYPKRSLMIASGGINCWDDIQEGVDGWICGEVNTAVDELPPAQCCAIYNKYLQAVFRFPRDNYELLLEFAYITLEQKLRKKGVLLDEAC